MCSTNSTRGKAPIIQHLPGESKKDYADFSSKILHLKGDRKDIEFMKASLSAEGFDVVYDINGMACDTFLKIVQKYKRKFVIVQDFHPFSMTIDGDKLLWSWNN
ncbi:unnamed protein product [Camellia sinensis]|uniref:chloroplast stem-loop binding protein of 41 kDa b, chloroplastic-like n=1 Tax=Camellia sinensis TaxID=4442 RepID=UPI0010355C57|nr:chloroplast stem-loop binding protein of 41 kDa b, chloroplastic-like [Camellia sinensis]XP_028092553.1 chloroplast stem-loop binding protein of 41 kDa b, chloroplastic-like [Camellia sinensis]XP_028092554.1 chloroplast stem-loop binding protein of 41 kDa b, chloroplastic-like [Camellia sinensis]